MILLATLKYNAFKQDMRTRYDCRDGLPSCNILSAAFDKDGKAWLGTDKGAVCFENGSFVPSALFDGEVQAMYTDRDGNLWVASGCDVCTSDGINRQTLDSSIVAISQDHNGRLRLITEKFLYKYEDGRFIQWYWLEGKTPLDMCAFADGEIFVAAGDSIKTALGKRLRWFNVTSETSKLPECRIQAVAGDKLDSVWVGTDKGIIVYDTRSHYVTKKMLSHLQAIT